MVQATRYQVRDNLCYHFICHVRWVPCHHSMARPRVEDGRDGHQHFKLAANILNKQPRTKKKGWSYILGVGRGTNNPLP
jgi:hypothetical protein